MTYGILHLFIDRIVVVEKTQRYSRTAKQCVWIYYCDIERLDDVTIEFDILAPQHEFVEDDQDCNLCKTKADSHHCPPIIAG